MKVLVAVADAERDRPLLDLAIALAREGEVVLASVIEVTGDAALTSAQPEARARRRLLDTLGADVVIPNAWKQAPLGIEHTVPPPGVRRSRYVLKVQDGCDNRCTFCIVWQTRGRSLSRVLPYLEERARSAAHWTESP